MLTSAFSLDSYKINFSLLFWPSLHFPVTSTLSAWNLSRCCGGLWPYIETSFHKICLHFDWSCHLTLGRGTHFYFYFLQSNLFILYILMLGENLPASVTIVPLSTTVLYHPSCCSMSFLVECPGCLRSRGKG